MWTNRRTGALADGENDDFGMIDVNGNPYPQMVAAVQLMHNVVADETGDSGPICDSWAAEQHRGVLHGQHAIVDDVPLDHRHHVSAHRHRRHQLLLRQVSMPQAERPAIHTP